jgi:hypothetical protein
MVTVRTLREEPTGPHAGGDSNQVWLLVDTVVVLFDPRKEHAENSEVLLKGSVAVAVITTWPGGIGTASALKLPLPLPFVVTVVKPR